MNTEQTYGALRCGRRGSSSDYRVHAGSEADQNAQRLETLSPTPEQVEMICLHLIDILREKEPKRTLTARNIINQEILNYFFLFYGASDE